MPNMVVDKVAVTEVLEYRKMWSKIFVFYEVLELVF